MMATLRKILFPERRKRSVPVAVDRRKLTRADSTRLLRESIDRFAAAMEKRSK